MLFDHSKHRQERPMLFGQIFFEAVLDIEGDTEKDLCATKDFDYPLHGWRVVSPFGLVFDNLILQDAWPSIYLYPIKKCSPPRVLERASFENTSFSEEELKLVDAILAEEFG